MPTLIRALTLFKVVTTKQVIINAPCWITALRLSLSYCITWSSVRMVSRHVSHGREVNVCRTRIAMVVIVFMAMLVWFDKLSFFTSTGKLSPTKPGQVSLGTPGAKVLDDMPRLDRFSSGFGVYLILRGAAQNTKVKEECFRRLLVCSS